MIDLTTLTARKIAESVRRRELTAVAVAQSALERIGQLNDTLHAFITVTRDEAIAAAEQVDRKIAAGQGKDLPLAGVPMAIKDSFWTKGVRTTGGTKVLASFVPTEDATAVARLKAAGCVLVGKSLMHEMAYGFTSRNPHYGDCRNPWDPVAHPRREQRRQRRGAGHGDGAGGRRRRHRRLEPPARGALRRRRREGHLRPCQPPWRDPAELVDGHRRPDGSYRGRRRRAVAGHGRIRPQGPDHPPRHRSRLLGGARRRPERATDRHAARSSSWP